MRNKREEKKAKLMKEAERIIDELLEWDEQTNKPKLSQIEEIALRLRQQFSEKMTETIVAGQEAIRPVPGPLCTGCQKEMRYKGMFSKTITSWVGEVTMGRGYFYCDDCKSGLFPPG